MQLEVWVLVDAAGDYAVGNEAAQATERYEESVQPLTDADGFRLVKVTLEVALPVVVELTGDVPADGTATLSVA